MKGRQNIVFVILAMLVLYSSAALALPNVEYIRINGDQFVSGDKLVVERGEELNLRIKLQGVTNDTDLEVRLDILGYEYNDWNRLSDSTSVFDIKEGETIFRNLAVSVPANAQKDEYDLRVRIGGRVGASEEHLFRISVQGPRNLVTIRDVLFSPENEVIAGRALLATVRIKNAGEKDQASLKVRISIPELGISASDYIDELREEKSLSSEELFLRIPTCVEPGLYKVRVAVEYNDGYEVAFKESMIRILEGESCGIVQDDTSDLAKTIITIGSTSQEAIVGKGGIVYPITITNTASSSKTYRIGVDGTEGWATVKVTPSSTIVLGAGETQSVYVYLTANENAPEGERMFSVSVKSGLTTLKDIPLKVSVTKDTESTETTAFGWAKLKRALEIGLIILVVLLVILGLIIGFNKLKGKDNEEEEGQTYY
jgi:uncharacterized membrane protein